MSCHVGKETRTTPAENACVKCWRTVMVFGVEADAHSGLEMASEESPDVILLDTGVSLMDGCEAAKRLKTNDQTKFIPAIGLAADAASVDRVKAHASGCGDCCNKSADVNENVFKDGQTSE